MLLEASYLPLNFAPSTSLPLYSTSCHDLPSNCSIAALRGGFRPFPVRRPLQRQQKQKVLVKEVKFRSMKRSDVETVRKLHNSNLPVIYPSSFYTHLLISPSFICLVAEAPSSTTTSALSSSSTSSLSAPVIGCISARLFAPYQTPSSRSVPTLHMLSLIVVPSARRSGLGKELILSVIRQVVFDSESSAFGTTKEVYVSLHVLACNEAALQLYNDLGLQEVARNGGYYGGGIGDAIEMGGLVSL